MATIKNKRGCNSMRKGGKVTKKSMRTGGSMGYGSKPKQRTGGGTGYGSNPKSSGTSMRTGGVKK